MKVHKMYVLRTHLYKKLLSLPLSSVLRRHDRMICYGFYNNQNSRTYLIYCFTCVVYDFHAVSFSDLMSFFGYALVLHRPQNHHQRNQAKTYRRRSAHLL